MAVSVNQEQLFYFLQFFGNTDFFRAHGQTGHLSAGSAIAGTVLDAHAKLFDSPVIFSKIKILKLPK